MSAEASSVESSKVESSKVGSSKDSAMPLTITPKAIETVKKAIAEEGLGNHGLRIAVNGGGCSGLQYALDFADKERMGDSIFEVEGLKVFIDMASLQYLTGTTIDYVSGLNGNGFKFDNPNATRTCGCGHSFS